MKTLNLSSYGVEELNEAQMSEVTGGFIGWIFGGIMALATIADAIWDIDCLHTPADWFR